jgi:hypothetical protein
MIGKSRIAALAVTAAMSGLVGGAGLALMGCSSGGSGTTAPTASNPHACKGMNACKGQGGCKTGDKGCKGLNSCKGNGGCKVS